jgi:L-histidine N-alpha-methyltransferase
VTVDKDPPLPTTDVHVEALSTPRALHDELLDDVRAGFADAPRWLPPKYFYDATGSALFERITALPEYYPTRAETAILEAHAGALVGAVAPEQLVELGSGSSRKTVLLLEAMHTHGTGDAYVPFDVSEDAIRGAAAALGRDHPWLDVRGYVGDFTSDLHRLPRTGRRLVAFLGSTIGNLDPNGRAAMLGEIRSTLDDDEALLLGADLVKDPDVLVAAYDDATGVTAAFNRNLLHVLRRELGADVEVDAFVHRARWEPTQERVEMWLVAVRDTSMHVPELDLTADFAAGEGLRTELSCKFRRDGLTAELEAAGLAVDRWSTDPDGQFALVLARPA